jgi:hypothetical protein
MLGCNNSWKFIGLKNYIRHGPFKILLYDCLSLGMDWLIDWCLTSTLAVFQQYRDVLGMDDAHFHARLIYKFWHL